MNKTFLVTEKVEGRDVPAISENRKKKKIFAIQTRDVHGRQDKFSTRAIFEIKRYGED